MFLLGVKMLPVKSTSAEYSKMRGVSGMEANQFWRPIWWYMPEIPALGRRRQEGHEFKASLGYRHLLKMEQKRMDRMGKRGEREGLAVANGIYKASQDRYWLSLWDLESDHKGPELSLVGRKGLQSVSTFSFFQIGLVQLELGIHPLDYHP